MGWFTRSKIKRGRPASEPSPPSVSITDPPNVFTAARPPPRNNGGPSSPGFAAEPPPPPPPSSYQPSPFQFASSPGRASGPPPGHPPQHRVSPQQQQQQQQHQHQQHQQRRSFSGLSPHPPPSHPPPSQQLRTPFQGPSQPTRPSPSGGPPPPQQHRTPLPPPSQPRPIPSRPPQTQHNSHPGPHPARSSLPTQILHPPNQLYSNPLASLSQPHLQPSGFLPPPPPPGWNSQGYQPVIVNQHYYLGPPLPPRSQTPHEGSLGEFNRSVVNLAKDVVPGGSQLYDEGLSAWNNYGSSLATSVYDHVYSSFNNVMTLIDREHFYGNETDLFHFQPPPDHGPHASAGPSEVVDRGFSKPKKSSKSKTKHPSGNVTTSVVAGTYFSKIELYANSRLPRDLPPLILYTPTWPLLCLAAQYSQRVYDRPTGNELDAHVNSDWRTGTKAMCIKSVPMDDMHTIIFAIRGTATFMDWAVNLNMAHSSPHGFLDDPGNLCHAGFLSVAKKMIKPVAARLRQLLQENPSRSSYSLLITGHSAGGAVAALLYSHMLATSRQAESELNLLTGCFKRIHCVTFGTPPVSLLPLTKPNRSDLRKSVFLSFINEGDPVVRADKGYIRSLLEVLALPPPVVVKHSRDKKSNRKSQPKMIMGPAWSKQSSSSSSSNSKSSSKVPKPVWKVPACTLSNAGRLVLLRSGDPKAKPRDRKTVKDRLNEGVLAVTCGEETLRGVIFGDPVAHMMSLYAGRIEILAVGSITGKRR